MLRAINAGGTVTASSGDDTYDDNGAYSYTRTDSSSVNGRIDLFVDKQVHARSHPSSNPAEGAVSGHHESSFFCRAQPREGNRVVYGN